VLNAAAPSVVTFGEVMLRLTRPTASRLASARALEATYGGRRGRTSRPRSRLRHPARFVTRVPANDLGEGAIRLPSWAWRGHVGHRVEAGASGVYYLEPGAANAPAGSSTTGADSCIARAGAHRPMTGSRSSTGARWFHTTGITPGAVGPRLPRRRWPRARRSAPPARPFRSTSTTGPSSGAGVVPPATSWPGSWPRRRAHRQRGGRRQGVRHPSPGSSVAEGHVDPAGYAAVAAELAGRFPKLQTIAFTQRGSISASENTWSGVLWTPAAFHVAKSYRIAPIVDRGRSRRRLRRRADPRAARGSPARRSARVRRGRLVPEALHSRRREPGVRRRGGRARGRRWFGASRTMMPSRRLEVLLAILDAGVLPLFYTPDAERALRITAALREGGARAIEFTDRGPGAWRAFTALAEEAARHDTAAILGAGSSAMPRLRTGSSPRAPASSWAPASRPRWRACAIAGASRTCPAVPPPPRS
jgi:2-dehydro-3-deoxygluconokinase